MVGKHTKISNILELIVKFYFFHKMTVFDCILFKNMNQYLRIKMLMQKVIFKDE